MRLLSDLMLVAWVRVTMPVGWPQWTLAPDWYRPAARMLRHYLIEHKTGGLFSVIFLEEMGVPLPVPGDVAITLGGYMTTIGAIPYPLAYVAVVAGAVTGSLCLFSLNRWIGYRLIHRAGKYIGLTPARLDRAERALRRWGVWAVIIGRHIPGMRIVLSALAGTFGMPYRLFVPSVLISSLVWAAIFLELGRHLGRRAIYMLTRLVPAHLVPYGIALVALIAALLVIWERAHQYRRAKAAERSRSELI